MTPQPVTAPGPTRRRRIGILCLSAIPDDPRVRRQGDLMTAAGWDVVAIGLPGWRSASPGWTCLAVDAPKLETRPPIPSRIWRLLRTAMRRAWAQLDGRQYKRAYWRVNPHLASILDCASRHDVDLWLANDWTTLPIAARLSADKGVPYAYDTHELASTEYNHSLRWRLLHRPLVVYAEGSAIQEASFVTCVSQGIADRLAEVYPLSKAPTVIRNMPHYEQHPVRPTGSSIEVLYHGIVTPGRGLEACIKSVALWRPEFKLTIRGPGSHVYLASLTRFAKLARVEDRVEFAPPIAMTALVARAAEFDVGLFALPGHSSQNVHVLPNKFFEYVMASLAVCVSDLPEMSSLVNKHGLGHLIGAVTPEAIATAINAFTREDIDRCKRNAARAATCLNWDTEAKAFLALCERSVFENQGEYRSV